MEEVQAHAINDKMQVVGYSVLLDLVSATLYQKGKTRELEGLWGPEVLANAINNQGIVVGYSSIRPGGVLNAHACLWQRGADRRAVDLGSLGGRSVATDINDQKQVVGWSSTSDAPWQRLAFLWRNGEMLSLRDLIPQDSGWTLTTDNAINNKGQIVGTGIINGKKHAFLLTPQQ
jgi:probable HAF family extracellular repeat protein